MKSKKQDQRKTAQLKELELKTQIVYSGNYLKVNRDEVLLPDRKKAFREYIKHPGGSLIIPILPNGKLIMIEQFRYALKQVFLEFPAGRRDRGENFKAAAHRELTEEIGFKAKKMKYLTSFYPVIGYADEEIQVFMAWDLVQKKQNLDEGEFLNITEVSFEDLKKKVWAGEITDVKTQIAFFWLEKELAKKTKTSKV